MAVEVDALGLALQYAGQIRLGPELSAEELRRIAARAKKACGGGYRDWRELDALRLVAKNDVPVLLWAITELTKEIVALQNGVNRVHSMDSGWLGTDGRPVHFETSGGISTFFSDPFRSLR